MKVLATIDPDELNHEDPHLFLAEELPSIFEGRDSPDVVFNHNEGVYHLVGNSE